MPLTLQNLQENSGQEVLGCTWYNSPAVPSPPRGSRLRANLLPEVGKRPRWPAPHFPGTGQQRRVRGGAFPAARMRGVPPPPAPRCPAQARPAPGAASQVAAGSGPLWPQPRLGSGPGQGLGSAASCRPQRKSQAFSGVGLGGAGIPEGERSLTLEFIPHSRDTRVCSNPRRLRTVRRVVSVFSGGS